MYSPQLYCTYRSFVHQIHLWKEVQRRGRLSRVNGTIKMQQALNIKSKQKAIHFQTCYFLLQNCGHQKQLLTPVLRFSNHQPTKSGSTFSPRVCDAQPLCRSHAHLFERDYLLPTTGLSHCLSFERWGSSISQTGRGRGGWGRGEGEVNYTLKKD